MKHVFTDKILEILTNYYGKNSEQVFDNSYLIQYLNEKTRSAQRGSKARGNYGNLYAVFVLVEDYINKGFEKKGNYAKYEGAKFSDLLKRQRELPFGSSLQNHQLNHRMNEEFKKFFPTCDYIPIIRGGATKRYWINDNLLEVMVNRKKVNISRAVIKIIYAYIDSKTKDFKKFIQTCEQLKKMEIEPSDGIKDFILSLLEPNMDARIFEIVSYAILKADYYEQSVFFGYTIDSVEEENLKLYKTGRTNANDGGIDFVMKPLGRFFQVTETTDVKKYFLDIDKLEKFPITFVIKSTESPEELKRKIKKGAEKLYSIEMVVNKYVSCIEEIINIKKLKDILESVEASGKITDVLNERECKVFCVNSFLLFFKFSQSFFEHNAQLGVNHTPVPDRHRPL
ncbi:MAG: hypothetical protein K8S56_05130, partial [Candidatus Cloacimonetes bacterium]|nr:hypothetical protein [Candidatus Cloacimonadota bacterium]